MNLELLESFGQNYPEEFDGSLDSISMAVTCQFNRYRYLAIDDHEYMRTYFGFNIEYKVPKVVLHNQAGFGIRIHIRSASAFEMRIRIHVLHSA